MRMRYCSCDDPIAAKPIHKVLFPCEIRKSVYNWIPYRVMQGFDAFLQILSSMIDGCVGGGSATMKRRWTSLTMIECRSICNNKMVHHLLWSQSIRYVILRTSRRNHISGVAFRKIKIIFLGTKQISERKVSPNLTLCWAEDCDIGYGNFIGNRRVALQPNDDKSGLCVQTYIS